MKLPEYAVHYRIELRQEAYDSLPIVLELAGKLPFLPEPGQAVRLPLAQGPVDLEIDAAFWCPGDPLLGMRSALADGSGHWVVSLGALWYADVGEMARDEETLCGWGFRRELLGAGV